MDDLIFFFYDKKVLELINCVTSHTMDTNKTIIEATNLWFTDETECSNLYGHITFWDTVDITTMNYMFYNKPAFDKQLLWNTNNVKNMSWIFYKYDTDGPPEWYK